MVGYRGIEPPENVDLYRYQNGEIVIRERRDEHTGTGPPWHSHKIRTSDEGKARKRLAAWLKQKKIEGVDPATVPLNSSPPGTRPELKRSTKANLPAVIPQRGKTPAEIQAYKNGYAAASYHVKKGKGGNGNGREAAAMTKDLVGALAANLNVSAVVLKLLQQATEDTTSD